jgi:hypothetical protein
MEQASDLQCRMRSPQSPEFALAGFQLPKRTPAGKSVAPPTGIRQLFEMPQGSAMFAQPVVEGFGKCAATTRLFDERRAAAHGAQGEEQAREPEGGLARPGDSRFEFAQARGRAHPGGAHGQLLGAPASAHCPRLPQLPRRWR